MPDVIDAAVPSRKRRLLAIYVDYLVFSAAYQPIAWAFRSFAPLSNWLVAVAVFAVLRSLARVLRLVLPGRRALGMATQPIVAVDAQIRGRERWWTMLAGVLLVLEGSKNIVRWTQGLPVEPLLGSSTPQWLATAAITIFGALNIVAGLFVLRTRWMGAAIGIAVVAAEALAALVHRDAFKEWVAEATVARRALQGVPVREGEIDMMQSLVTGVMPVIMVAGAVWLLAVAWRFRAPSANRQDLDV